MSAVYLDDYYTSRAKSTTNLAKSKRITEIFTHLLMYKVAGDYGVEWVVRDGTIQDITSTISTHPDGAVDSDEISIGADLDNLLKTTLIIGWHGVCGISWTIDHMGQVDLKLTQKRKFQ